VVSLQSISMCPSHSFRASEPAASRNLLSWPETFLTKICIVSSSVEEVELMLEMLDVRRMVVGSVVVKLDGRVFGVGRRT
jgi:hypothetical protein